jgi:hypothetical protein
MAWWAHIEPMLTMAPPPALIMPRVTVWVRKKAEPGSAIEARRHSASEPVVDAP